MSRIACILLLGAVLAIAGCEKQEVADPQSQVSETFAQPQKGQPGGARQGGGMVDLTPDPAPPGVKTGPAPGADATGKER
jgi:hypothetical protein